MSEANLRKVTKKLVIVTKDEGLALKNHLNLYLNQMNIGLIMI